VQDETKSAGRKLRTAQVRKRYGDICQRTVDRWVANGTLPPPEIINGRRYFDEEKLNRKERERMTAAA
jgi:DNA-binding transcriptional MerR regulator